MELESNDSNNLLRGRIAFVASSLLDQDSAPTSFFSKIWNSKPSTFGKTINLDGNLYSS